MYTYFSSAWGPCSSRKASWCHKGPPLLGGRVVLVWGEKWITKCYDVSDFNTVCPLGFSYLTLTTKLKLAQLIRWNLELLWPNLGCNIQHKNVEREWHNLSLYFQGKKVNKECKKERKEWILQTRDQEKSSQRKKFKK